MHEQDIRQASHQLYPSIVKLGLVPAMTSLRDRFWRAVQLDLHIGPEIDAMEKHDPRAFPDEFKVAVYRIVEEALDNVVKHAHARKARVALSTQGEGNICLEISDDGRRFDVGEVSPVFGLLAIRDYAEALGGNCRIQSQCGEGTAVRVVLPAPSDAHRSPWDHGVSLQQAV